MPQTLVVRERLKSSLVVSHFLKMQGACQSEKADGKIYSGSGNVKHAFLG